MREAHLVDIRILNEELLGVLAAVLVHDPPLGGDGAGLSDRNTGNQLLQSTVDCDRRNVPHPVVNVAQIVPIGPIVVSLTACRVDEADSVEWSIHSDS